KDIEQRLAQTIRGGADVARRRRREVAALQPPADDAHPFRLRTRTSTSCSLVPRLQIALAMIAALRAPRRSVATGLGFVARARFVAAGALHQHAAALAVGDQAALAGQLERLFAARCIGLFFL